MRFARIVFTCAGIWGIAVLMPFYWLVDVTGRHYAPPTEYPHFFYGFLAVALAWRRFLARSVDHHRAVCRPSSGETARKHNRYRDDFRPWPHHLHQRSHNGIALVGGRLACCF